MIQSIFSRWNSICRKIVGRIKRTVEQINRESSFDLTSFQVIPGIFFLNETPCGPSRERTFREMRFRNKRLRFPLGEERDPKVLYETSEFYFHCFVFVHCLSLCSAVSQFARPVNPMKKRYSI